MKEIRPSLHVVLQEFSAALRERYGDRFRGLWLYGSQVRGEAYFEEKEVDTIQDLCGLSKPRLKLWQ